MKPSIIFELMMLLIGFCMCWALLIVGGAVA